MEGRWFIRELKLSAATFLIYNNKNAMKNIVYILVFISLNIFSQDKYLTKTGAISFEASAPSFEEVKAKNNSTTAILNTENGEFASLALVKGFRFKNALMEEHFNENYAESDKFPKAIFKGKITNFHVDKLNETSTTFKIYGTLSFHGKTVLTEDIVLSISKVGEVINITGNFIAAPSSFDIDIPKVVKSKVSNAMEVSFNFQMKKK